jgi:alkylresorcinol/alkylpyrone synthase
VLPLEQYRDLHSFGDANDIWIREGTALATRAVAAALTTAGLEPEDIDYLFFTSVTGIAAPSIDARLVPSLGLRSNVKRVPSFGLGCVAGAAGLARVHDYLLGHPDEIAVLVSVELCSLTLQRDDDSVANFVASGLFGDGAAAVVVAGADRAAELGLPGPDILGTRAALYPDSASVIGWDIGGTGFRIVLTAAVSDTIDANIAADVDGLLADHAVGRADVSAWVAHPGGPRVLEAFERGLALTRGDLAASWKSLDAVGNLSSSSVLHVLADMLVQPAGTHGVLFALGPGVTSEYVLLKWAA